MRAGMNGDIAKSVSLNISSGHAKTILRFQLFEILHTFRILYLFHILRSSVFWYVSARYMVTTLLALNGVSPFN